MLRRKKILHDQAYANTEKLFHINTISKLGGSAAASKLLVSGQQSELGGALSSLRLSDMQQKSKTLANSVDSVGSQSHTSDRMPKIDLIIPSPQKSGAEASKHSRSPHKRGAQGVKGQQHKPEIKELGSEFKHPMMELDSEDSILPHDARRKSFTVQKKTTIPLNDAVSEMPGKRFLLARDRDSVESQNWNMTPNQLYSNQSIFLDEMRPDVVSQSHLAVSTHLQHQKPEVVHTFSSS